MFEIVLTQDRERPLHSPKFEKAEDLAHWYGTHKVITQNQINKMRKKRKKEK